MAEWVSCWGSCTSGGQVGWVGRHSRRGGRGACRSRPASACEHMVRVRLALQPAGREASVRGVPEVLGLSSPSLRVWKEEEGGKAPSLGKFSKFLLGPWRGASGGGLPLGGMLPAERLACRQGTWRGRPGPDRVQDHLGLPGAPGGCGRCRGHRRGSPNGADDM